MVRKLLPAKLKKLVVESATVTACDLLTTSERPQNIE